MAREYVCNRDYPVVDTRYGKLRGFLLDGIFHFYGVQYAKAKRWQMPEEIDAWEGVKEATSFGAICPTNGNPVPSGEHLIPHRFWPASENCQNMNIWTPTLEKGAKKPVIVWYHGGGYADGSAIEHVAYDGDSLAEYGNAVVCCINHRLNILGFLDMSSYGEKYKNSGNAGMADIVASLQWIHDNIEAFGGDPENVTVFGQSGGGGKVCTLLQTPAAAGLFHKAMMMSGGAGSMKAYGREAKDHRPFIEGILKELDMTAADVEKLEKIPYSVLIKAYNRTCRKLDDALNWAPRANGWYLGHPVEVGFSEYAKTVPIIVSSVFGEFSTFSPAAVDPTAPEEEKEKALTEAFGADKDHIVELFKKAYPAMDPIRVLQLDRRVRSGVQLFMDTRAASGATAPGYNYLFGLEFEVNNGNPAWHCADIPFMFYNSHRVGNCNIAGVTEQLEEEMAGALVSFAYTGNPNHPGMAKWEPYTEENKATFVFDRISRNAVEYDRELIAELTRVLGNPPMGKPRIPNEDDERGAWLY